MSKQNIIRAWKDRDYRNSLSPKELASIPPCPAGLSELNSGVLASVAGGLRNQVAGGLAIQPRAQALQTQTVGSEVCCSTGDLPCGGGGGGGHKNWINLISVSL